MEYAKNEYASEAANRRARPLRNDRYRKSTNIASRNTRTHNSSSSKPRNISDESCKDDSSDFEEYCSVPSEVMSDDEIKGKKENNSFDHRNKQRRGKPAKSDIEVENSQTNTEISSINLMEHERHSDLKSDADQLLNLEPNENKCDRGLFFGSSDSSISDIEATDNIRKGRVLTSTPNSDIVEKKVLDAAKYNPEEESILESTLLGQSEITVNTSRNEYNCSFDIYHDPSSIENQQTVYSNMFRNNNIFPAPLPSAFQLPPEHPLPSSNPSSHQLQIFHQVSPQGMPQLNTQLQYPSPIQLCAPLPASFIPLVSSGMLFVRSYVFQQRLPTALLHAPNPQRLHSALPHAPNPQLLHSALPHAPNPRLYFALPQAPNPRPHSAIPRDPNPRLHSAIHHVPNPRLYSAIPHAPNPRSHSALLQAPNPRLHSAVHHASNPQRMPSSIPVTVLPRERFIPPRPQDSSNFLHMNQQSLNLRYQRPKNQDGSFYIPPPVPRPQMNGSQHMRYFNQCENGQSRQPSISLENKIASEGRISE